MPVRDPTPGSFEHLLTARLVRPSRLIRLSKSPRTEPYWSRDTARFDGPDIGADGGPGWGTCYAAFDLDGAFCESVIHSKSLFRNGGYEIPLGQLISRFVVSFALPEGKRQLRLADLSGQKQPLSVIGLDADICAGDDYEPSCAWARAIHDSSPSWDGIYYRSRKDTSRFAVAVFQRCALVAKPLGKLSGRELDALCDRYNVIAV